MMKEYVVVSVELNKNEHLERDGGDINCQYDFVNYVMIKDKKYTAIVGHKFC